MSAPDGRIVACPSCRKSVPWTSSSRWRPFCSERCQLLDLGEWASERRRIPEDTSISDVSSDDLDTPWDHNPG